MKLLIKNMKDFYKRAIRVISNNLNKNNKNNKNG